jgi:hypothetical protein
MPSTFLFTFKNTGKIDEWQWVEMLLDDSRQLALNNTALINPEKGQLIVRAQKIDEAYLRSIATWKFNKPLERLSHAEIDVLEVLFQEEIGKLSTQIAFENHLTEIADLLSNPKLTPNEKIKLVELKLKTESQRLRDKL